jgi:hypothetical protein
MVGSTGELPYEKDDDENEEDKAYAAADVHESSPFGSIEDPLAGCVVPVTMMVVTCAHHKLAILPAYFYGQRTRQISVEFGESSETPTPRPAATG